MKKRMDSANLKPGRTMASNESLLAVLDVPEAPLLSTALPASALPASDLPVASAVLGGAGQTDMAIASAKTSLPAAPAVRRTKTHTSPASVRHNIAAQLDENGSNRQAELFYLQKQITMQTQMVFVLEDGSRIQGVVEWYDRTSIKVRGKSRVLIYKSAIKYLYKAGEVGSVSD